MDKVGMKVRRSGLRGVSAGEIIGWVQGDIEEIKSAITQLLKEGALVRSQDLLFHKDGLYALRDKVMAEVGRFHKENPLKQGVPKEELRARVRVGLKDDEKVFDGLVAMINELTIDKDIIRLTGFSVAL